jgi:hypothetical protein
MDCHFASGFRWPSIGCCSLELKGSKGPSRRLFTQGAAEWRVVVAIAQQRARMTPIGRFCKH